MRPLDGDYTLRRIMEAPSVVRQSYAERLGLVREHGLQSVFVLPDDFFYRIDDAQKGLYFAVETHKGKQNNNRHSISKVFNPDKPELWFNSAGRRRLYTIEEIPDAEQAIKDYKIGSCGFDLTFRQDKVDKIRSCSSFWPSHSGKVLVGDWEEARTIASLLDAGKGVVDTHLQRVDKLR